jgi:hypothetical protein
MLSVTAVSFIGGGWGVNTLVLLVDFAILAGILLKFGKILPEGNIAV